MDIYGTLGPACSDADTLEAMFRAGMTGVRLNLSHVALREARDQLARLREAAASRPGFSSTCKARSCGWARCPLPCRWKAAVP